MDFKYSDLQYMDREEWFEYANCFNSYIDLGLVVGKVQKPLMPQVQESTQDVPGMYGNIFTGNDYGELTFTIPVTIMAFDHTSYNLIIENLRSMLTADASDPGREYPLRFGDRPEVTYYGHWGQISDPTFLTPTDWQAQTNLVFICSQPYGYLPQETVNLTAPDQVFTPSGNASTYPIISMYLKQDVYNVGYVNMNKNGEYVATGYTVDSENTDDEGNRIQNNEPITVDENPTLLSDWITGNEAQEQVHFPLSADIGGAISDTNYWSGGAPGIMPANTTHTDRNLKSNQKQPALNYGYAPLHKSGLYGPIAIHPDFPNATDDWQIMLNLWHFKDSSTRTNDRAAGALNVYLLDQNHDRRGRIWIHDWQNGRMPRVNFALGKPGDEIDMVGFGHNPHDDTATGPNSFEGTHVRKEREQGKNQLVVINNLRAYKEEVKNRVKANKRSVRQANRTTRERRAKTRATRKYKTGDSRRHISHNYPSHRRSRKRK